MSLLKNTLNITSLVIHDHLHPKSIEHCFLFLTSDTFRDKTYTEQAKRTFHLREKLSKDVAAILQVSDDDTSNPKLVHKAILKSLPDAENLPKRLKDADTPLGKEFVFILEELVQMYRIVIVERETFVIHKLADFKESDKILIMKKTGSHDYYPVYTQPDKYIFSVHDDVVQLIKMFHIQRINTNLPLSNTTPNKANDDEGTRDPDRKVFVIDRDDIIFSDEEDLLITYNNSQNTNLFFTKEEEIVQIQNLLSASPFTNEKGTGPNLYPLVHDYSFVNQHPIMHIDHLKVAASDRRLDDWVEYIDDFNSFKNTFPHNPFVSPSSSPYFQTSSVSEAHRNAVFDETIARDSFTTSFVRFQESADVDPNDLSTVTSKKIKDILQAFQIDESFASNNVEKIAQKLSAYNFLSKPVLVKVADMTTKDIRKLATDTHIDNYPKSGTRSSLISFLLQHHASLFKRMFTQSDMSRIVAKHNLPFTDGVYDDFDNLYTTLSNVNLIKLSLMRSAKHDVYDTNKVYFTKNVSAQAEYDDPLTHIMAAQNLPTPLPENVRSLQLFRPSNYDSRIAVNGFYYRGDPSSSAFEVFDVANYLNTLKNIRAFLPLGCTIVFHHAHPNIYKGEILPMNDDDSTDLLKIKYDDTYIYYNLGNIHDNAFYVYPDFYDGYVYQKRALNKNIYFHIDTYPYEDMLRFVSLSVKDYVYLYDIVIDSYDAFRGLVNKFNIDVFNINEHDHDLFRRFVRKPAAVHSPSPVTVTTTTTPSVSRSTTRLSAFKFLQFDSSNISDLHKTVLLHKGNYFEILRNMVLDTLKSHSNKSLQTNAPKIPSTSSARLQDTYTQSHFESFDELARHATKMREILNANTNLELLSRQRQVEAYLERAHKVREQYEVLMRNIERFFFTVHEKGFLREMTYVRLRKQLEGEERTVDTQWIFINSDMYHGPLRGGEAIVDPNNSVDPTTLGHLDKLVAISGIEITAKEKEYIVFQSENITKIFVLSQKQKNERSIALPSDLNLYVNFIQHISFGAFVTIFAQIRYGVDKVFSKCSDVFSLHGYPLDDKKDKSFTKYIACIIVFVLKDRNKFVQSPQFVNAMIEAAIKIIFQQNPSVKTMFMKHVADQRASREKNDRFRHYVQDTFKPFFLSQKTKTVVENNLESNKRMRKHDSSGRNTSSTTTNHEFLPIEPLLQCLRVHPATTKRTTAHNIITGSFAHFARIPKLSDRPTSSDPAAPISASKTREYDERLTRIVESFDDAFFRSNPVRTSAFVDIFLTEADEFKDGALYAHLIKTGKVFATILSAYPNMQVYYDAFIRHSSVTHEANSTNITTTLIQFYENIRGVLEHIGRTDDIYTFLNISTDDDIKSHFQIVLSEFRAYVTKIEQTYVAQHVSMEALKQRAEVLREEDKQNKLRRFNNMDDDQIGILKQLETLGIDFVPIRGDDGQADQDEAERIDARDSDDHDGED